MRNIKVVFSRVSDVPMDTCVQLCWTVPTKRPNCRHGTVRSAGYEKFIRTASYFLPHEMFRIHDWRCGSQTLLAHVIESGITDIPAPTRHVESVIFALLNTLFRASRFSSQRRQTATPAYRGRRLIMHIPMLPP